jgi:hypothetical protein
MVTVAVVMTCAKGTSETGGGAFWARIRHGGTAHTR